MTLNEAIKAVLVNYGDTDCSEIATLINQHSLFKSKGHESVTVDNVAANVARYPDKFGIKGGKVFLKSPGLERLIEILGFISRILKKSQYPARDSHRVLLPAFAILLKYGDKDALSTDYSVVDYSKTKGNGIFEIMKTIEEFEPEIKRNSYQQILKELHKLNDQEKFKGKLNAAITFLDGLEEKIKNEIIAVLKLSSMVIHRNYHLNGKQQNAHVDMGKYSIKAIREKEFTDFYERLINKVNRLKI